MAKVNKIANAVTDSSIVDEHTFYHLAQRCSPEKIERLIESLQKVKNQINNEYERLFKEYQKNGDIIPPWREMIRKDMNSKMTIEVDGEMLDYIDNLNYIKFVYERLFKGKIATLKVGIELRNEFHL